MPMVNGENIIILLGNIFDNITKAAYGTGGVLFNVALSILSFRKIDK